MPKLVKAGGSDRGGPGKAISKASGSAKVQSARGPSKKGQPSGASKSRTSKTHGSPATRARGRASAPDSDDSDDDDDAYGRTGGAGRRAGQKADRDFDFGSDDGSDDSASVISGESGSEEEAVGPVEGGARKATFGKEGDMPVDEDDDAWYDDPGEASEDEDEEDEMDGGGTAPKSRGKSAAFDADAFDADLSACGTSVAAMRRVCLLLRVSSAMLAAASGAPGTDSSESKKDKATRVAAIKGAAMLGEDLGHAKAVALAAGAAVPRALWTQLGLRGTVPAASSRTAVPVVDVASEAWRALHVCTAVACSSLLRLLSCDLPANEALPVVGAVSHLVPLLLALASSPKPGASRTGRSKVTDAALHSAAERSVRRWGHALVRLMTNSDARLRVLAFLSVLELAWGFGSVGNAVDILYKAVYLSVIRASRLAARPEVQRVVQFLISSCAELWGLDLVAAYTHGFTFLRQLAGTVRQAMSKSSSETRRKLCSWQFVNGLRALQVVICKYPRHDQLAPLFYPLSQIAQSVLDLFPLSSWAPLQLQLISILNALAAAGEQVEMSVEGADVGKGGKAASRNAKGGKTDGRGGATRTVATPLYVPVASYILRILSSPALRQPKKDQAAPKDLRTLLRLKKETQLRSVAVQKYIVNEAVQLLLEHFALNGMSIAFPEIVCSTIAALRALRSELSGSATAMTRDRSAPKKKNDTRHRPNAQKGPKFIMPGPVRRHVQGLATVLRGVVEALEKNSAWILKRRQGVTFGPNDTAEVLSWEVAALAAGPPIMEEYQLALKRRERRKGEEEEEDEGDDSDEEGGRAPRAKRARRNTRKGKKGADEEEGGDDYDGDDYDE